MEEQNIILTTKRIRSIFEKEKNNFDIPFFYDFPKNCCEGASCFLAMILSDNFPNKIIEVVLGENTINENHFWVEVDGYVYDITADQFEKIEKPVLNKARHPLASEFWYTERYSVFSAMKKYCEVALEKDRVDLEYYKLNKMLEELKNT